MTLEGERACPSSNLFTVAGCVGLHPMQVSRQRAQQCDGLVGLHLMQYRAAAVHRQRLIAKSRCAVFFVSPMSSEILKPGSRCSVCTRCRSTVHGSMLTPTPTWTRPPSRASISTADLRPFDDLDPPQNLAPSSDEILGIEEQMIPEKVKRVTV